MPDQLIAEASTAEIGLLALLAFGMGFCLLTPFVWVFGRTVALKKGPDKRALWTVGLAYGGASLILIFFGSEIMPFWVAPMLPLPGAIIIYFWQRNTYRKGWVEEHEITEGMSLENDDWRIGVIVIVAILSAAALKVLMQN